MGFVPTRGELSQYKPRDILQRSIIDRWEGVLHFRFLDSVSNVRLVLKEGYIGDVFNQVAPQWSELLLPVAVHPQEYIRAVEQNASVTYALQALRNKGLLSRQDLHNALKERVESALLPIFFRTDGRFMFSPQTVDEGFLKPGVSLNSLLHRIDQSQAVNMDMSGTYHVLHFPKTEESEGWPYICEIMFALERGSTPLEITKTVPLSWKRLAEVIHFLEDGGFIQRFQVVRSSQYVQFAPEADSA